MERKVTRVGDELTPDHVQCRLEFWAFVGCPFSAKEQLFADALILCS